MKAAIDPFQCPCCAGVIMIDGAKLEIAENVGDPYIVITDVRAIRASVNEAKWLDVMTTEKEAKAAWEAERRRIEETGEFFGD